MSNAVMFVSFKLVEGASVQDFIAAAKRTNDEFISKQKGYISWKQLRDGEQWADLLFWETMDDARNAAVASCADPSACDFGAFIDQESVRHSMFSVERSF